jgi:hypothetical protein
VLYGIGINYQTDSAVSTSGGAQFSLSNAAVTMDLLTGNILSQQNWAPQITFTNPTFTTGSNIQLTPYMRWGINLAVSIYGQVALSPTITSETVVGLGSSYSFSAQGTCPANNLAVTSYVSTRNMISNGMGTSKSLHTNQQYNSPKCYNVPSNQPSPSDMTALSASGQEFCTSYLSYKAPTLYRWITSSATVPSTTTSSVTTTITSTPIITIYPTTTITTRLSYTTTLSTVWVTATNSAVMPTQHFKRDNNATLAVGPDNWIYAPITANPSSSPSDTAASLVRRVATPAVVSGWAASKISYACSQVATGKATVTSTITSTTTSGVTTATQTVTANANGPLSTITSMRTVRVYAGFATTTVPGPTTATQYSCPLQTEVSSCITVTVHGLPHVDGKLLRYYSSGGNPTTDPNAPSYIWYLSCNGTLVAFQRPSFAPVGGYPGQGYFLTNFPDGYPYAQPGLTKAVCVKDTSTKTLDCTLAGVGPMYILPASYAVGSGSSSLDTRANLPLWPPVSISGLQPIALTYEDVECPCVW